MTISIALDELYRMIRESNPDSEGYVSVNQLLLKASEFFCCKPLTVRNFINKHRDLFEFRHGLIGLKKVNTMEEQIIDTSEYEVWLKDREEVLNECLEFLKLQTPNPYIENIWVQCASARDDLYSFSDSKLLSLIMTIKRDFNFSPTKTLSGSM